MLVKLMLPPYTAIPVPDAAAHSSPSLLEHKPRLCHFVFFFVGLWYGFWQHFFPTQLCLLRNKV